MQHRASATGHPADLQLRSLDVVRGEDRHTGHHEPARSSRGAGVRERLGDLVELVAVRGGVTPRAVVGLLLVGVAVVAILGLRLALVSRHARTVPLQAAPIVATAEAGRQTAGPTAGSSAFGQGGSETAVSGATGSQGGADAPGFRGAGSVATAGAVVVVHVVGQVNHAGVVRLPAGSRVEQALAAAGGATSHADLVRVNLARPVVDGEQIVVPRPGQVLAGAPGPQVPAGGVPGQGTTAAGGSVVVDLNAATLTELDGLPGIGPVLAQRILDWRGTNRRFSSVDELGEVSGIGEKLLAQLRPRVRV